MKDLERKILQCVTDLLNIHSSKLKETGIEWRAPKLEIRSAISESYESEIVIDFFKNNNLHDVIEFHVFLKGKDNITPEECHSWLNQELSKLI